MAIRARGFSLIEMVVVVGLVMIGSGIALLALRNSIAVVDADKSSQLVSSQLRYARQVAVDQRRNVRVEFLGTNQVRVTRLDGGGGTTVMADVSLPAGYTFKQPMGVADTPDGFGSLAAVYFNGGTSGTFQADGTFVNGANILLNGTVFTMGADNGSARAITLTGSSGRTATYWLESGAWKQQ